MPLELPPTLEKVPTSALDVPAAGSPLHLPTDSGQEMSVIIDATGPGSHSRLWGMSLLERNIRLVERLGATRIHVLVRPADQTRAGRRRFPGPIAVEVHPVEHGGVVAAADLVRETSGPVLVVEAAGVYDRRFIGALWQRPVPACGAGEDGGPLPAAALLVASSSAQLMDAAVDDPGWQAAQRVFLASETVYKTKLDAVGRRIPSLRKSVDPLVIDAGDQAGVRRADEHLRALAGKGVNDFLAEYVHPPIEFFLTRLVARTALTPNQVAVFYALFSFASIPLIASGHLWEGLGFNMVRGILDGVDGKLARLTLRESRGGHLLDKVIDWIYLPPLFLTLGYYLAGGDWWGPPMLAVYVRQVFSWLDVLFASWCGHFLGVSSGEVRRVDRVMRRFWPRRNITMLILTASALLSQPEAGLYCVTGLTILLVLFRLFRLDQEARRVRRKRENSG
jgi:phosphatidylglycerophosphate synthase